MELSKKVELQRLVCSLAKKNTASPKPFLKNKGTVTVLLAAGGMEKLFSQTVNEEGTVRKLEAQLVRPQI